MQRINLGINDGDYITLRDITRIVRRARNESGLSENQAAQELGVKVRSVKQAEGQPHRDMLRLRRRILERFTGFTLDGPYYQIRRKV